MRTSGWKSGFVLFAMIALVAALLPGAAHAASTGPTVQRADGVAAGYYFTPVAPTRIYVATQQPGSASDVPVTGTIGIDGASVTIPSTATAVVLNLTGTAATTSMYVTAYPKPSDGSGPPVASQLDLGASSTSADLVTVGVGSGGDVRLFHSAGSVELILDISGYYSPDASADTYVPIAPHRVYDSGAVNVGQTPVTVSRATLGLPAAANAVVLNLTETGPTSRTLLTAWSGGTRPNVSNLNVAAHETRANLATVKVGSSGLSIYNALGRARVIVDVAGWYDTSSTGSTFVPMAPVRIATNVRLGPNGTVDEQLETSDGVPSGASAALFTLTAHQASQETYEQAYPTPTGTPAPPSVSNVNVAAGAADPNLVIVAIGAGGAVRLRNSVGTVSDIVDLAGYFLPMAAGHDASQFQCSGSSFPNPPDSSFAVVDAESGYAFSDPSPCFAAEDEWAAGTGREGFYLVLTDVGPMSSNWPKDNGCVNANTPACAYEFGENQAADAYADAAGNAGSAAWWLDVEEGGVPWQSGTAGQTQNARVVAGAVYYLKTKVTAVGLYSTATQWSDLTADASGFSTLPEWYASTGMTAAALVGYCSRSFAGGPVTQVQDGSAKATVFDVDLMC